MIDTSIENERRCKLLRVDPRDILNILGNWQDRDGIRLPVIKGLPEGFWVRNVAFEFARNCFVICIQHPSFPEVQPGSEYPFVNNMAEFVYVNLREMTNAEKAARLGSP